MAADGRPDGEFGVESMTQLVLRQTQTEAERLREIERDLYRRARLNHR